jgi:hypothetical protein
LSKIAQEQNRGVFNVANCQRWHQRSHAINSGEQNTSNHQSQWTLDLVILFNNKYPDRPASSLIGKFSRYRSTRVRRLHNWWQWTNQ